MAEQLREVETLKQQFFSQISHEIRNPLTAIRAATQLLLKRGQQTFDAKERQWLASIDDSVDRLPAWSLGSWTSIGSGRACLPLEAATRRAGQGRWRGALDVLSAQAEQQGCSWRRPRRVSTS